MKLTVLHEIEVELWQSFGDGTIFRTNDPFFLKKGEVIDVEITSVDKTSIDISFGEDGQAWVHNIDKSIFKETLNQPKYKIRKLMRG